MHNKTHVSYMISLDDGRQIHVCADCDGPAYQIALKNKRLVVRIG